MSTSDHTHPQRKHLAQGVLDVGGQPTIVFDTVCTRTREPWLASPEVHRILIDVWTEATAWLVGRYMIMPDHIHFFAGHRNGLIGYESWVRYWKSQFSRRFQQRQCRWQIDGFDTRLRSAAIYEEKWRYVLENPVRAGLVTRTEDWPYQGEIHQLRWD